MRPFIHSLTLREVVRACGGKRQLQELTADEIYSRLKFAQMVRISEWLAKPGCEEVEELSQSDLIDYADNIAIRR